MKRIVGVCAIALCIGMLPGVAASGQEETCREQCCLDALVGGLVINEIHYNPPSAMGMSDADWEFVELWNASAEPIDLADYVLDVGRETAFEPGTMVPAGGFAVVAVDPESYAQLGCPVIEMVNNLSNVGEPVLLRLAATGAVVDQVIYDDRLPWPPEADNDGPSLELIDPAQDNGVASAWAANSSLIGGTPGALNSVYASPAIAACAAEDVPDCFAGCMAGTLVELQSFRAFGGIRAIHVVWATAWETDTAGFNLYRDGQRVNARLIVAENAPGGAIYRYWDRGAAPYRQHTYTLEEVTRTGEYVRYSDTAVAQCGLFARLLTAIRQLR